MKVEDLKHCIRPVMFKYSYDGENLNSIDATSFGVKYKDDYYIITLEHIIGSASSEMMLFYYENSKRNEFLPLDKKFTFIKNEFDDDTDKYQLVAFRVDKSEIKEEIFNPNTFFKLENRLLDLSSFDTLLLFGHPKEKNSIDFDSQVLEEYKLITLLDYINPSKIDGCHEIKFRNTDELKSYAGLSGSPVFGVKITGIKNTSYVEFLGIMNRATKTSGAGYFIEHQGVITLLEANKKHIKV